LGTVWRRESSWKNLSGVYKYLKGGCKENGARLFFVVPCVRIGGNSYKLTSRMFPVTMRKHLFSLRVTEPWERIAQTNWGLCPCRCSEANWMWYWATGSEWPCWDRGCTRWPPPFTVLKLCRRLESVSEGPYSFHAHLQFSLAVRRKASLFCPGLCDRLTERQADCF